MKLSLLGLMSLSILLCSCVSSPVARFKELHLGMEKHDVLELMDNPTRTRRSESKDKWTYVMYDHDVRHIKEVHFYEGVAVYIGDPIKKARSGRDQFQQYEARTLENRKAPVFETIE